METDQDEENDKFIAGQMEIDDADDMAEVADILLRLDVSSKIYPVQFKNYATARPTILPPNSAEHVMTQCLSSPSRHWPRPREMQR